METINNSITIKLTDKFDKVYRATEIQLFNIQTRIKVQGQLFRPMGSQLRHELNVHLYNQLDNGKNQQ